MMTTRERKRIRRFRRLVRQSLSPFLGKRLPDVRDDVNDAVMETMTRFAHLVPRRKDPIITATVDSDRLHIHFTTN